ncbi:MAG: FAD-dependent oxidoreductase [Planctomycetota bacterium]
MATAKNMRVVSNDPLGARGRLIVLESAQDVDFRGGQFLIVDTGLRKEDGAPLKRCYSVLSADADQRRVQVAVQRVGPGSEAMQALEPGTSVPYSGPWGKLLASAQEEQGPAWVIATDTGITAALGLVLGAAFAPRLHETTLVWMDSARDALLSDSDVRERLPSALSGYARHEIPEVGAAERIGAALDVVRRMVERTVPRPAALWLVGDGDVLHALRDDVQERLDEDLAERASVECFFNNPKRVRS